MKRNLLLLSVMTWVALGFTLAQAQDNGVPDTLYLEIYPGDDVNIYPAEVRFNLRVTNDIPDPYIDSIAGICLPFCFTSSNPAANALIPSAKNNTNVYPFPDLDNSIFRHMPSMADPQERNFMMDYSEQVTGVDWDTRILDLGGGVHFWMSLVPTGVADQRFPGGSRVLVTAMTFWLEDTTTLCIDTCFWPPTARCFIFSRSDAVTYNPQHFLPVCQLVTRPGLPPALSCPPDQQHGSDGHTSGLNFSGEDPDGIIVEASSDFVGQGVENVTLVNLAGLGSASVTGQVEYDVTDHCQGGGLVTVTVLDDVGWTEKCEFDVVLSNSPPEFSLFDTWRALTGYTMGLQVSVTDPNGDEVAGIELDGFWYEPDSLQSPINPPSFDGGNPALLTWVPDQSETGNWICSFTAADACGAEDTHLLTIQVGTPFCGDCTGEGDINLGDVVCLISYLYRQGPPPDPLCMGDANGDGSRDVGDVVLLINYLFKSSFAPCFCCCP
ncbi:MAG: dockerin type I repeat-containing protein [Candidatus Zixiibacteriota bacterium]|nr:MAG: dockerin type I repeat-containing protein [candidate division Zixibacteria bacterium]